MTTETPGEIAHKAFHNGNDNVSMWDTYPDGIKDGWERAANAGHVVLLPTGTAVNHPAHYGGVDNLYEVIKVIEAWGLGFSLGNAVKYIGRAGNKVPEKELEDLRKARWYLDREIQNMEKK